MTSVASVSAVLLCLLVLAMAPYAHQLQSSQAHTMLRIQRLLDFPDVLSNWTEYTDFCNIEPTSSLTVVCYEESITQLHIIGRDGSPAQPRNFSIGSFFTTLVTLPDLKVLTLASLGLWGPFPRKIARLTSLEILNMSSNFFYGFIPAEVWSLRSLQTLILDNNMFRGHIPDSVSALPLLAVLSLKNNSLSGFLPESVRTMENLRVLALSNNQFSGELPDLSSLTNLQVLDLEHNYFGRMFPAVGNKIVTLILRNNRFSSGIPSELSSDYQLDRLDISFNRFVGPFPPSLLSLPSIHHLSIEGNRLTGMLFENISCNPELEFVDLSDNLLRGSLPACLRSDDNKGRIVQYWRNCLLNATQDQHPHWYCQNQALAVGITHHERKVSTSKVVVVISVGGGVFAALVLFAVSVFMVWRRFTMKKLLKRPPRILIAENPSTGISSKLLSDARYISQTMKLGALGLPSYRYFSLEELEEATSNFDQSTFIGEGSHGQMYRGRLKNGSPIAIRCVKLKRRQTSQNFIHDIELISKLRHFHLVSVLGHCFECNTDDATISRLFIIFEYVPNGTLRSRISEGPAEQRLSWTQRISAAIGVAKGIQFLHTGIVPGIFANNLKITNVLLDQNLSAKIGSYNLPLWEENMEVGMAIFSNSSKDDCAQRRIHCIDKTDVYEFGVILLEIVTGWMMIMERDIIAAKLQLQESVNADEAARSSAVDPAISNTCSSESLKTVVEICIRCLSEMETERPSVEDILWNLQFAAQVQEAWRRDSQSTEGSPVAPSHPPHQLQLALQ